MQAYAPVIGIIQFLECRLCNIQRGVGNNGMKIVGAEALSLNDAQALVSLYDARQVFRHDPGIMGFIYLPGPIGVACNLFEILA